jgi:hypothetical protein
MNENELDTSYTSVPWPCPTDRLFPSDVEDSHVANLDLGGKNWWSYGMGYKDAADILVQQFLENPHGKDALVFPIIFNYRQYLELRLKQLTITGQALLHERVNFRDKHNLITLWQPCREILCRIWPNESASIWKSVEKLLREFDNKDPEGFAFRYPITTEKQGRGPTIPTMSIVGIRNLHGVMQKLGSFFDAHLDGVAAYRHDEDLSEND